MMPNLIYFNKKQYLNRETSYQLKGVSEKQQTLKGIWNALLYETLAANGK